jgi:hypothetical protein
MGTFKIEAVHIFLRFFGKSTVKEHIIQKYMQNIAVFS